MNHSPRTALAAAFLALAAAAALRADVKMPAIFGDHMVLQQNATLPVWGLASPGEKVAVSIGGETGRATADASGQWRVELPPLKTSAESRTLRMAGANKISFSDVLVGDVWLCSGQSNMEFGIGNDIHGAETIAASTNPQIRLFLVPQAAKTTPQSDLAPGAGLTGKWQLCTPQTLGGQWGWNGFSAVGYYFGREIQQSTGRPVGLIGSYWGGTPAQAWTSLSGLQQSPELQHYVKQHEAATADPARAQAAYQTHLADFQKKLAVWQANGGNQYEQDMKAWKTAVHAAAAAGQAPPTQPVPPSPKPRKPESPDSPKRPTNLYNGMIAPLVPFALKGVIWYQGEANAGDTDTAVEYATLFPDMIRDWRQNWGQGDFPFLFVQLASYNPGPGQDWPLLRESQAKALALPQTGMATAIDIGDPNNIHPPDKRDVGHRLGLIAEHIAYGKTLEYSGAVYSAMQVQGNAVTLTFDHEDGGLVIGHAPWAAADSPPLPTDHLVGFTIAGADQQWRPADAKINRGTVVVTSPQVPTPVAVRYDWADAPQGNLYNQDGLPAYPFRTDNWPPAPPGGNTE